MDSFTKAHLKNHKKKLTIIFKTILLLGSCYSIYFFIKDTKQEIITLFQIDFSHLFLALLLTNASLFLSSYRLLIIIEEHEKKRIPLGFWYKIFIVGKFFNNVLPQSGNIYRSSSLKKLIKTNHFGYASAFFFFIWIDVFFNFLIGFIFLIFFDPFLEIYGINGIILFFSGGILAIILPKTSHLLLNYLRPKNKALLEFQNRIQFALLSSEAHLTNFVFISKIFFSGLVLAGLTITIYFLLFNLFGAPLKISKLILFFILFKLTTYINLTPGNIGIRELFYGILSSQVGESVAVGVVVSGVIRVLHFLVLLTNILFLFPKTQTFKDFFKKK
jgi:uncharacterized membrane protein YbhN (UPF0104 family)